MLVTNRRSTYVVSAFHHHGLWFGVACTLLLASLLTTVGCYRTYICESGKTIEARDQMGGQRVIIDVGEGDII